MIAKSDLNKINDYLWEIPKSFRAGMQVPARIYVSEKMLTDVFRDKSLEQLINTATLPGIVKYAIAMPDAHEGYGFCLFPQTKILSNFGYCLPIKDFEKIWKNQTLKTINLESKIPEETKIKKFLKLKPKNKVLKIVTKTGREIIATEDHPFYTPQGMVELKKLNCGDKIAVFPFEGVPYKKPSDEIIISEDDIKKTLLKLGRKPGEVGFEQNLRSLKKRSLLPLTYNHPKLPYLLKIMGFVFGDGTMNFIGKKHDGIISFSGKKNDLEKIREDIKEIGYTPSSIYRYDIKNVYENYWFYVNASSLLMLLKALGQPIGKKAFQEYRVPKWIFKAPLWQKRLFLASFFGAELRKPHRRKSRKTMFNCPVLTMRKAENLISNGKLFLNEISKLLKEFGVKTIYINQRRKHINKKGEVTQELELVFSSEIESLINLWSKIGFEYNRKRSFMANVATQYLKYKKKILDEKRKAIEITIPNLLATGLSYRKIAQKISTTNPLTKRFITDICWKLNKGFKKISPQVPAGFPSFKDYFKKITENLGEGGIVWDEIEEIKEVPYKDYVYDFTVNHPGHNFIANNFLVSNCIGGVAATKFPDGVISPGGVGYDQNCGVRLLISHYTEKEIKSHLEKLATEIQKEVPSGLGRGRQIKLSIAEIDKILEGGIPYLVNRGYGEKEDIENCEHQGRMEMADPSCVSEMAKNRGRDQVGTLGSGNHFLEIQKVTEIFDEEIAKAFGLFKDQVVVMIHTGSRGLGHQNCTDYLRIVIPAYPKYGIKLPDKELACVPFNSPEGQRFFKAMSAACNFAWANRHMIMHYVRQAWKSVLGEKANLKLLYDVAHNIAKIEGYEVDGEKMKLIVHRKGATRAFPAGHPEIPEKYRVVGQPVIIPGSMGTASYVLVGTEKSKEAWYTVCHGAGRTMSRHAATRALSGQEVVRNLESRGIIVKCYSMKGIAEEAPMAYKNIDEVVEVVHFAGLSKKVAKLVPLAVIKGE